MVFGKLIASDQPNISHILFKLMPALGWRKFSRTGFKMLVRTGQSPLDTHARPEKNMVRSNMVFAHASPRMEKTPQDRIQNARKDRPVTAEFARTTRKNMGSQRLGYDLGLSPPQKKGTNKNEQDTDQISPDRFLACTTMGARVNEEERKRKAREAVAKHYRSHPEMREKKKLQMREARQQKKLAKRRWDPPPKNTQSGPITLAEAASYGSEDEQIASQVLASLYKVRTGLCGHGFSSHILDSLDRHQA
ncbi:hypothetical protein B0H19DRAFT_1074698 [Mycena capillaripes]|nr:hypothetical protein B0H19DRAFT_1074698 [Mycena capillaripes]